MLRSSSLRLPALQPARRLPRCSAQQPAAAAGAQPQAPSDQRPPVTFSVEVNYVEIDAIVTDAQGNFVRDLTKDDFEVVEEGKPQDLSVLSLVDIPIERPDAPLFSPTAIEPDVRSNTKEFNGRVFVLVLDDLQTHFARSVRVRAGREAVHRAVSRRERHRGDRRRPARARTARRSSRATGACC